MVSRTSGPTGIITYALVLAVGVYCTLSATEFFRSVPGDLGDARFNSVILEHLFRYIRGATGSLWDPGFFYPFSDVLTFSDNLFGSGIFYVIGRLAGLSRAQAVDFWFVVGSLLNFVVAHLAIEKLGLGRAGAAVGAFIFAFGIPALATEAHIQLSYRFAIPIAVVSYLHFLRRPSTSALANTSIWVALQFYCSIYLGMFVAYLLAAITVAWLATRTPIERPKVRDLLNNRRHMIVGLAVTLLCVAAVGYLLAKYGSAGAYYGFGRSWDEIAPLLPRPQSYLLADGVPVVRELGMHLSVPARSEQQLFFGGGAIVLAIVGIFAARRNTALSSIARVLTIAFILLVVGTLSVTGISLYQLTAWLPGIGAIRAVSRIVLVLLFPVAVLAAIGATAIVNLLERRLPWKVVPWLLMVLLAVTESATFVHYRTSIADWDKRQERLKSALPSSQSFDDRILVVRSDEADVYSHIFLQLDAMVLAQDIGSVTMNGYSGNSPPSFPGPGECLEPSKLIGAYEKLTEKKVSLEDRLLIVNLGRCGDAT